MGAWGSAPFENDQAMDWASNSIERPILDAVKLTVAQYLANPEDDVLKHEAEAAIALMLDLANNSKSLRYCRFEFDSLAMDEGIWELGIDAISKLRSDSKWLADWKQPEKKLRVLDEILQELHARASPRTEH
jgi:hypothetical protein